MTRAAQPGAKWIDPDPAWPGDVSGVAVSGGAGEGEAAAADPPVDRFHNHENMSPEAMAESIAQLQASVAALTWRIAVLESDEGSALGVSRRLGKDVVEMGGALARRMHMLEGKIAGERPPAPPSSGAVTPPAPADLFPTRAVKPRRPRSLLFVLIVALLVIVALAAAWVWLQRQQAAQAKSAPPQAAVAPSPTPTVSASDAPAPTPVPAAIHRTAGHNGHAGASKAASAQPTGHVLYGVAAAPPADTSTTP